MPFKTQDSRTIPIPKLVRTRRGGGYFLFRQILFLYSQIVKTINFVLEKNIFIKLSKMHQVQPIPEFLQLCENIYTLIQRIYGQKLRIPKPFQFQNWYGPGGGGVLFYFAKFYFLIGISEIPGPFQIWNMAP